MSPLAFSLVSFLALLFPILLLFKCSWPYWTVWPHPPAFNVFAVCPTSSAAVVLFHSLPAADCQPDDLRPASYTESTLGGFCHVMLSETPCSFAPFVLLLAVPGGSYCNCRVSGWVTPSLSDGASPLPFFCVSCVCACAYSDSCS